MREYNLKQGDPLSTTIAADARLTIPNYCDDQIWELSLGGGEPPALALQTTYGLRARSMRLFPRFVEGFEALTEPERFATPPVLNCFYPNFLQVSYMPLPGIEATAEYWAAQSEAIAGRLRITNRSDQPRQVRLEWVALMTPGEEGERMAPAEIEGVAVLSGRTGNLIPLVFITGGAVAVASPFPALVMGLELAPWKARQLIWTHAAKSSLQASFEQARQLASHNWEAEKARIDLLNAGQVEIRSGDADWDAAFALTQKTALNLFVGPTLNLPHASITATRRPDDGYSLRGDGSDYGRSWSGQTPLEACFLAGLITPAASDLVQGLVENFLSTQNEAGEVDWKPGLGGQRAGSLAAPLLAGLTWRIYQTTPERAFLERNFPKLLAFLQAWFTPEHDRDGDGVPEWDHDMQAGFEDHPLFSRWHRWAQGVDITTAESPSLCAMLYRECRVLIEIARTLGRQQYVPALQAMADNLKAAVEVAWDAEAASYHYWDRETHNSPPDLALGARQGSGIIPIERDFPQAMRLVVRIQASSETTRRAQAFLHGSAAGGQHRVERIPADRFQWYLGLGTTTSTKTYTSLEYVEFQGLDTDDQVSVHSAGLTCQDHTTLLPLWAGIPIEEHARSLVEKTITHPERYWRPYGIPACPDCVPGDEAGICECVDMYMNSMIGEGLVAYGYRAEAAELTTRLMKAVVQSLKGEGCFHRYYHAESGQGSGEHDALRGLAPLGLFLETLGVRLISPHRVALAGFNPFPWPVTVKYRGLTVLRQKDRTQVIFPDGQTVSVEDPEPRIVSLE